MNRRITLDNTKLRNSNFAKAQPIPMRHSEAIETIERASASGPDKLDYEQAIALYLLFRGLVRDEAGAVGAHIPQDWQGAGDKRIEVLARMWIECDPNRMGSEPGSGWHTDDIDTRNGEPRWKWFVPRAEATLDYFDRHGMTLSQPSRSHETE